MPEKAAVSGGPAEKELDWPREPCYSQDQESRRLTARCAERGEGRHRTGKSESRVKGDRRKWRPRLAVSCELVSKSSISIFRSRSMKNRILFAFTLVSFLAVGLASAQSSGNFSASATPAACAIGA